MKSKKILTLQDAARMAAPANFSTMVKPAGSRCNLDCAYCYYLDKSLQYGGREETMSDELLEEYIRQYIGSTTAEEVLFCWHGGEPLLLGIDFYRRAVEYQRKYIGDRRILNTLQTNGVLLDDEWSSFLADNGFLVGVSLDGPEDIHDAFRVNRGGRGSFEQVMRGVESLRRHGAEFNTLSVVNSLCEGRGAEVYRFLKSVGSNYMQFLPAVEHTVLREGSKRPVIVSPDVEGAELAPWSVSAEGYGRFLCDVFDDWVIGDVGRCFVQMFDATLAQWARMQPGVCSMCETCGEALVVEHNGDVYPCDHFVYPEYRLGNILETPLARIFASRERFRFGLAKRNSLPRECLNCRFYFACRGECPKHRFEKGDDGFPKNSLCAGLKLYFEHVTPYMDYMKELIMNGQPAMYVIPWARRRMGLM